MNMKLLKIMPIRPQSAKGKGRKHQQWVRAKLLELFPQIPEEDIKSTAMGQSGLDLQMSKLAKSFIPYGFEMKSLASSAVYKPYEQAVINTYKASNLLEPVLILKGNHRKPLAIIDAEHFFKLVRARYDASVININDPDKDAT